MSGSTSRAHGGCGLQHDLISQSSNECGLVRTGSNRDKERYSLKLLRLDLLPLLLQTPLHIRIHHLCFSNPESPTRKERQAERSESFDRIQTREDLGVALCETPEEGKDVLCPVPVHPPLLLVEVVRIVDHFALFCSAREGSDELGSGGCESFVEEGSEGRDMRVGEGEEDALVVNLGDDGEGG